MKLLFIILSSCMLFACTITKRQFNSGYHVEWRRTHEKQHPAISSDTEFESKDHLEEKSEEKFLSQSLEDLVPKGIRSEESDDFKITEIQTVENLPEINEETLSEKSQIEDSPPTNYSKNEDLENRKTEPLTLVSLILFIALGASMGAIAMYGSILFVGAGVLATCLAIAMFVCSLISLIRIHREPNRYKNKGLTHFIFSLSIMCLVTAATYLIGVIALTSLSSMHIGGF